MRILISSYYFHPSIGGIETVCGILAQGLVARGHAVTVATMTPAPAGTDHQFPFEVVRGPGLVQQYRMARAADVIWQNGISLRFAGMLATSTSRVFAHHGPLKFAALKRLVCRTGRNVFVSDTFRTEIGLLGPIIPNAYDQDTFRNYPDVARDRDVAYLGRLVPEKGADILIDALKLLAARNIRLQATVIGVGPEAEPLQARANELSGTVDFPGAMRGEALARTLSRHKILVIPSRWDEPFGVVALEGMACGCAIVVADSGALPQVIGPCGMTVPKNDPAALADALALLTGQPEKLAQLRANIPAHIAKFSRDAMIDACEAVMAETIAKPSARLSVARPIGNL